MTGPKGKPTPGSQVDLAVVGGGSAGFAAAIRAAELGATVALVEGGVLGGTCVNVGCVPSKTLLRAADVQHRATRHAFAGIRTRAEPPELAALIGQKDELVAQLQQVKYRDVLAAHPSVALVRGRAAFRPDGTLTVDGEALDARKIVLSMGAAPWAPPIPGLRETPFWTSTEALSPAELPHSLAVIGGSAVGLELGQLYARLGSRVTVLEAAPRLVPAEDAEVGEALAVHLAEEGIEVLAGARIRAVSREAGRCRIEVEAGAGTRVVEATQLLVATGRRPGTAGMGLPEAGIRLGDRGEVVVDQTLRTTREGVYAAGDVIGDPAFVYVAALGGSLAAENALQGSARPLDLSVVPRVTFTDPAIGSVGLTEAEARGRGIPVAVSRLPMALLPRALAARDTRGFIKLVADPRSDLLVGAHILAPEAGELVQAAAMAIRFRIPVAELAAMLHPYLTYAEGLKLACLAFRKDVTKLSCCAA